MPSPLLEICNLSTVLTGETLPARAVDQVSIEINHGETYALLGESGCGKSMTALSVARLLPDNGRIVSGSVRFGGTDLVSISEKRMREIRGRHIGMIFQEPGTSLNPVLTVGAQLSEVIERHTPLRGNSVVHRSVELLDAVGIPDANRRLQEFPFQLSGGMKQRVMIASALACEPQLLIADEPTTALDVTIQAQVLDLLRTVQAQRSMSILLITHDLGVVAQMADNVGVMYAGQIVEQASCEQFFTEPAHPYSRKLFESMPSASSRGDGLAVIRGNVPSMQSRFHGCRFVERCEQKRSACSEGAPDWVGLGQAHSVRCLLYTQTQSESVQISTARKGLQGIEMRNLHSNGMAAIRVASASDEAAALLEVKSLKVHFPIQRGFLKRVVGNVKAVDGVSLRIGVGECVALVGESGCGKSTAGKAIVRLYTPTSGHVKFGQVDLAGMTPGQLRAGRKEFQIIFQDPYASLNPRMRVGEIIEEGMLALDAGDPASREKRVDELLTQVGLPIEARTRYPHEFSGGQRQRIAIARALAVGPKLIVCDEPTSALDVSVQAQILNLLAELRRRLGLSYLFITHDFSVVEFIADKIAVMYLGRIVEFGDCEEVLKNPRHPYTRALISAVPSVIPGRKRPAIQLEGDLPSPASPPSGCQFHPRCQQATSHCASRYPESVSVSRDHTVSCHLYGQVRGVETTET